MGQSVKIIATVNQHGATASEGKVRDHKVIMDRPEAKGGEDQGPMGGENLLLSLGGCFMSNLLAAAQARKTPLKNTTLQISGEISGTPPRFERISMTVSSELKESELMKKLITIAERGCIVANTLKQGVKVTIHYIAAYKEGE